MILFGGGDGGGIIIGPDGIKPIPPWNPDMARGLRAIASLTQMSRRSAVGRVAAGVAEELATMIVPQLVRHVEGLGDSGSVLYIGFDGDFFCGSTGKKPLPLPRPKLIEMAQQEIG